METADFHVARSRAGAMLKTCVATQCDWEQLHALP